jgi:aspartyl-tRNA(Asn)/glutamyl-tRNA(Gln) amidotransferase subunit A
MHDDIAWLSAADMASAIRATKLSPVEVTEKLLGRIDAVNPAINAYVLVTRDRAMQQAKAAEAAVMRGDVLGPLHGVPLSIKDLFDVPGLPTTKGSLVYKDNIATRWEFSAQRLIEYAGGIHLGKTNTPEFGFNPTTENKLFGASRNPWDTKRTPGGSSGGAAAAVAAGLGPIALSSDGGGSIRIPASMCGVFGIKPTYGRVPKRPGGGWQTLTHRGPTARTVTDAALALDVMTYYEPEDPFSIKRYPGSFADEVDLGVRGLRVAWSPDLGYAPVDTEVRAICERAARRFADLGCTVDEANPGFASPAAEGTFLGVVGAWDATWLGELSEEQMAMTDVSAKFFLEYGRKLTGMDVVRANKQRWQLWETMQEFHKKYDLLLTPVISCTAFPIGEPPKVIDGKAVPDFAWMGFTQPFNLNGAPAASMPVGFDPHGMPVGLHIVGRAFADATVLRAARAFEQLEPWAGKKPSF